VIRALLELVDSLVIGESQVLGQVTAQANSAIRITR